MESRLIRLRDNKTVWIYADGLSADLEELSFKASSTHGHYLSISLGERKAAVFPFEIFTIDGETFYFGPEPGNHQIVRPSRVKWIRPSDKHTTPIPGMLGVHAVGALLWLMLKQTATHLRGTSRNESHTDNKGSIRLMSDGAWLASLTLAIMTVMPRTIHAPAPSQEQRTQSTHAIDQVRGAQTMRANLVAEAMSKKDSSTSLGSGPGSGFGGIKDTQGAREKSVTQRPGPTHSRPGKTCRVSDQLSVFMSPSQLRSHFKGCNANER
jgi:hypothetical protein